MKLITRAITTVDLYWADAEDWEVHRCSGPEDSFPSALTIRCPAPIWTWRAGPSIVPNWISTGRKSRLSWELIVSLTMEILRSNSIPEPYFRDTISIFVLDGPKGPAVKIIIWLISFGKKLS